MVSLSVDESCCINVVVRVRPMNDKESERDTTCIEVLPEEVITSLELPELVGTSGVSDSSSSTESFHRTIQIVGNKSSRNFTFDQVFPPSTNQEDFYETCVECLLQSCLEGYNATIFAYGQTGSGKTHTMMGDLGQKNDQAGVIPRALKDIFLGLERISASQNGNPGSPASNAPLYEYEVKAQFLELYGEKIHDLIKEEITDWSQYSDCIDNKGDMKRLKTKSIKGLNIRDGKDGEDAVVIGLCEAKVQSSEEAMKYLQRGTKFRVTGPTAMNSESSRSHAIFSLVIQQTRRKAVNGIGAPTLIEMKTSKINFVDLAGSERIKKSQTEGLRKREGININKGLFVLGNVISAFDSTSKGKKKHVPYRDSKLTRLLKGSLGGNHKTLMVGCASPSSSDIVETISTLRYTNRAKHIKNRAKVNIDPSFKVITELEDQVLSLATELLRRKREDNINELECPFSTEFLENLIRLTGSRNKLKRYKPLPIRPSSVPTSFKDGSQRPMTAPVSCNDGTDYFDSVNVDDIYSSCMTFEGIDEEASNSTDIQSDEDDAAKERKHVKQDLKLINSINRVSKVYPEQIVEGEQRGIDQQLSRRSLFRQSLGVGDLLVLENDDPVDASSSNETNEDSVIGLYDSMRVSMRDALDGGSKMTSIGLYDYIQESMRDVLGGSSKILRKGKTQQLFDVNENADNEDFVKIMNEYQDGLETLRLESKIKLIESKIKNCTNKQLFLSNIATQLDDKSLHSEQVDKSIGETKVEIAELHKELHQLLLLQLYNSASKEN